MIVTIDVTRDDIDQGVRTDCMQCPVARAIRRALGLDYDVSVGPSDMDLGQHTYLSVLTPAHAAAFMGHFDAGHPVAPFRFELNVPDDLMAQVTR